MNISVENIDKVNAVMTAVVEPADYTEKYEKAIKDAKKKMNMPGFRPGMVPVGLIKKQFGVSILAEEVNKILQDGLFNYIRENKINMLGEPLPTEENNNVDLKEGESFTFKFELAIAPEFEVKLTKKDKVDYYNVEVTDQMVDNQVDMYRQRGGKYDQVDSYEDNDMVKGVITELNVETPVTAENVVMLPKYFKNDDQKKLFDGVKVNDVVTFNPSVAYDNNEAELTSLLKVEKEDALNHKGEFTFQVTEITRFVLGPLDQELFDTVFPGGEVKTEADFRAKVKELLAYLIDRRGATVTNTQLRAILWMDGAKDEMKQRKYFAQLVYELQGQLNELGLSDVFRHQRDSYAIVPDKIPCDYYRALARDVQALSGYQGEYMSQYEWAAYRYLTNEDKLLSQE